MSINREFPHVLLCTLRYFLFYFLLSDLRHLGSFWLLMLSSFAKVFQRVLRQNYDMSVFLSKICLDLSLCLWYFYFVESIIMGDY